MILFIRSYCVIFLIFITGVSCKKLVQVNEPINTITTSETFATLANAISALTAIYSDMSLGGYGLKYANGGITIYTGLSGDELNEISGSNDFQLNRLQANNGDVSGVFWTPIYYDIYMANAVIENVQSSKIFSSAMKNQLVGEAKFLRAYCYFYLTNLFGDVPLVTSTAWIATDTLSRSPAKLIYKQIILDLVEAQMILPSDYSVSNGERIRANKWAVAAFLAKIYLYQQDWKNAELQSFLVINNSDLYQLTDLSKCFLKNNSEAILQLQLPNTDPYATREGNFFIPPDQQSSPSYYLTDQLLASFEIGDNRRNVWVDSTIFSGVTYYYPYKYKIRQGTSGSLLEYYTLLRLGEQYLIRAEARAQQGNLSGNSSSISDLNVIRERAGLNDYVGNIDQVSVLNAIYHERQIEMFAEIGNRWFDLKRTNRANNILSVVKGSNWKSSDLVYPIPYSEILVNSRLTQNDGY